MVHLIGDEKRWAYRFAEAMGTFHVRRGSNDVALAVVTVDPSAKKLGSPGGPSSFRSGAWGLAGTLEGLGQRGGGRRCE